MSGVLFIGRSVLDVTALVEKFPPEDGKVKALANDIMPGGPALNAAVVFAHLGGRATLASSIGVKGFARDVVIDDLQRHKVEICDICDNPNYAIPLSTVISTTSTGARMIVNGANDDCCAVKTCADLFTQGFALIQLDQYEYPFVKRHQSFIRAFEGPVILDGGSWKSTSPDFLRLADIPIVSEAFCFHGIQDFSEMCTQLGLLRWAVTHGDKGITWWENGQSGHIPAIKVSAIDTLGAGDIFHGAFCYHYAQTGLFLEALGFANAIAAKTCTRQGTREWMNG